ncbi:low molecular weight protein-tyrosine-phosphatase [Marinobacterium arenosum]|uniref:low molecular weight protein-tyrosine-phosphatase n=1 Tax=Marinobacterium arenosum TaxID=2862496 RepID=UPI001C93B04A|nr:low molecular weight protein-tyrosine-phosphatase [Marinobacterium arenosum]MBY4675262.1 low molecular weight phosphotyrosine protein phosphatase [Marinobacterium arenosum]
MTRVLFVCLGNICRSPTAHGVFLHKVSRSGMADLIEVDSAGTAAYHIGKAPDARATAAAARRGYDLSPLRARQAKPVDFQRYDYVLAMDSQNLADLRDICPADYQGHLGLFLEFAGLSGAEVPDPYYGGDAGFERVLDLVEQAADGLLQRIRTSR